MGVLYIGTLNCSAVMDIIVIVQRVNTEVSGETVVDLRNQTAVI